MYQLTYLLLLPLLSTLARAQELSCSSEATDPCRTPMPGGLFVFRQRFEPDVDGDTGSWGLDGLEVLDCETQETQNDTAYSPAHTHEEIGSYCLKSSLFSGEANFVKAESEWAQSEVGEGVEELWERAWNTAGRFISTFKWSCYKRASAGHGVPEFFHTLGRLHKQFPTDQLLSDADIYPSEDTSYSLIELTNALSSGEHKPVPICDNTTLSSIHWPLHVRGSFHEGHFEPSTTLKRKSNCPAEGIHYPPSTTRPRPTQPAEWDILRRPPPRPITLSHDESRLYYKPEDKENPKKKLAMFKEYDSEKEEEKEDRAARQFSRDEL
ncbi:hypothetical protein IAT38_002751 [Cryptococcus sp. DSM 104549]